MTIQELFDDKIIWFDNPLDLNAFEEFESIFVAFLKSKEGQIIDRNIKNIEKSFSRFRIEMTQDYGGEGSVYYLRFYTNNSYTIHDAFNINGYTGRIGDDDELANAREAYDERIREGYQSIENNFLINYDETTKLFDSLNEQEDDFDWLDLQPSLPNGDGFVITFCDTPVTLEFIHNLKNLLSNYTIHNIEELNEDWLNFVTRTYLPKIVMYFEVNGNDVYFEGYDTCYDNMIRNYENVFTVEEFTRIYGRGPIQEQEEDLRSLNLEIGDIVSVNGNFQGNYFKNNIGTVSYFKGGREIAGIKFEDWYDGHDGKNYQRSGPYWEFFVDRKYELQRDYTIEKIDIDSEKFFIQEQKENTSKYTEEDLKFLYQNNIQFYEINPNTGEPFPHEKLHKLHGVGERNGKILLYISTVLGDYRVCWSDKLRGQNCGSGNPLDLLNTGRIVPVDVWEGNVTNPFDEIY